MSADVGPWEGNSAGFEEDSSDKPPYVQEENGGFEGGSDGRTAQLRTLMSVDDLVDR